VLLTTILVYLDGLYLYITDVYGVMNEFKAGLSSLKYVVGHIKHPT